MTDEEPEEEDVPKVLSAALKQGKGHNKPTQSELLSEDQSDEVETKE